MEYRLVFDVVRDARPSVYLWWLAPVGFTWYPLAEIQWRFRRFASALSSGRAPVVEGVVHRSPARNTDGN